MIPPRRRLAPRAHLLPLVALLAACAPAATPAHTGGAAPPASAPPTTTSPSKGSATILPESASPITIDRIAKRPGPGMHVPIARAFSPDGRLVTFLASESESEEMSLFAFDVATHATRVLLRASDLAKEAKPMSREEELRRERQRMRATGISFYRWAKKANVMVVPSGGDLYAVDVDAKSAPVRLTDTPEPELDPKLCDTGAKVAYVRGRELYVTDRATKRETALTTGAPEGVTRGQSDYNAQEELDEPSGFFWSPTCDKIAYVEVDERPVGTVPVVGYRGGRTDVMMQKYPLAGAVNPVVRAGIVDVATKKTTWIKLPTPGEKYLTRFEWAPDGKALYLQTIPRDQMHLALVRVDPATGAGAEIVTEASPVWVEPREMRMFEKTPRFAWVTNVDGHAHLQIRDARSGAVLQTLTHGDFDVSDLLAIDEAHDRVTYASNEGEPLGRQVFTVPAGGGPAVRRTKEKGTHMAQFDEAGQRFVDVWSALDHPPTARVFGEDGAVLGDLPTPRDADFDALRIRAPEIVTVKADDGTTLYGALLKPRTIEQGVRYPVLVEVYGGPHVRVVNDGWMPSLLDQHLADRGIAVFALDNRGSFGRGLAFEGAIKNRMGQVELADQLRGVDYLASLPFVDASRIAIHGHSYGGFMAALAMLKAPDRFKVGIAGSPVTDFRYYDSGYTERYMGTPEQNAAGYDGTDLSRLAPNLRGKLLIVHALMDENVHFINTAALTEALVAAKRPFDLFVFPGERHGYRDPAAQRESARRIVDYITTNL